MPGVMARRRSSGAHPRGRSLLAGVAALMLLAACGSPEAPPTSTGTQVEVLTWWASGPEKLAMDTLVQRFRADHPDITFVDAAVAGGAGSLAKDVLASRLADGDPPDAFQVHGGAELAAHVAAGDLAPLTDLADDLRLPDGLDPDVLSMVSVDGEVWAVPVDLHRANLLWANTEVLAEAGLDPTAQYADLDAWFETLETVRATGRTPLALGSTWTQVHLLEVVLLARLGPEAYAGLWDGTTDATSPAVATAVGDFARLLGFTNADRNALDWEDTVGQVADGEAAYVVMGDWAAQLLTDPVVRTTFPGTEGVYDVVLDAFAQPALAPRPQGAAAWLSSVADPRTQTAFANAKGAMPARSDVVTSELAAYPRAATEAFRSATRVPSLAHGAAVYPDALTEITRVVGELTRGATSASRLQAALAAAAG